MNRFFAALLILSAFFVSGEAGAQSRTLTDAAGRKVEITDASRIVSIGGSVTEVIYALGLGERVVAVDQTSTFPEAARTKPNVGYMRALAPEGVLKLGPSLILAIEGSGPPDAIEILQRASVPLLLVPEAHDAEGIARKIRFIAEAAGVPAEGEKVAAEVLADLTTLAKSREAIKQHRKAVFVLAMGSGGPIAGGAETSAQAIFTLAGVDNALTSFQGFKPVSDESLLQSQPDAVVVMADRDHVMNADTVFAMPGFAATPAAKTRTLVALPGLYLLGFGPRTAHAAHDLAAALYPEAVLPSLPPRPWTSGKTQTQ